MQNLDLTKKKKSICTTISPLKLHTAFIDESESDSIKNGFSSE